MDGVPAFAQCPIPPDNSFTYRFKAELYGSIWYHAHYSPQYVDGATGPLIVHGPKNVPYDVDLGPLMLSDWYWSSYFPIVQSIVAPSLNPPIPTSGNNLINGKMNFNCSQVPSIHMHEQCWCIQIQISEWKDPPSSPYQLWCQRYTATLH